MQLSLIEDPAKLKPQAAQVLRVLRERGSISAREAMALSPPCYRLAARIMELREVGHRIDTERESHAGGSHARYRWLGR